MLGLLLSTAIVRPDFGQAQVQKLAPSDPTQFAAFGESISLDVTPH